MLPPQSGNLTKIFNGIWNYLFRHTTSLWRFNSSARLFYWVKTVTYTRVPVRLHVCKTCCLLVHSLCVHNDVHITIIYEFNLTILMKIGLNGRLCSVLYLNNTDMAPCKILWRTQSQWQSTQWLWNTVWIQATYSFIKLISLLPYIKYSSGFMAVAQNAFCLFIIIIVIMIIVITIIIVIFAIQCLEETS